MDTLRTFFRHHAWATLGLIDHCLGLAPELLEEPLPGTRGTIQETLVHLVAADQRYLERADGRSAAIRIHETEETTLAQVRRAFEGQVERWEALLDRAGELDVTIRGRDGTVVPHATDLIWLQAIHHGNDHRTHACTVLGAKGLAVPDLSGWAYWSATHG